MATRRASTYTAASGEGIYAGIAAPAGITAQALTADAGWTWFSDDRAVWHGGALLFIGIASDGTVWAHRWTAAGGAARFQLSSTGFEADDHDNGAVLPMPDGRVLWMYCKHPDTHQRFRVWDGTGGFTLAGSWTSETTLAATEPSYSNLAYLSTPGRAIAAWRSGTSGDRVTNMRTSADLSAWTAESALITGTGARPYVRYCGDGVDTLHMLLTNCHPDEGVASVYHCKAVFDAAGSRDIKGSGGASLGATVQPADCTLIYAPTTDNAWVWDITIGPDGHPWALFTRFVTPTDHRLMFARWTGASWTTPVQVAALGTYLYAAQPGYSSGGGFDPLDARRVYASITVSGRRELQEFRSADSGATWAKHRDLTSGSTDDSIRPIRVRGSDGTVRVLWMRGTYTTYTDWATGIWGAG